LAGNGARVIAENNWKINGKESDRKGTLSSLVATYKNLRMP
jgi:hypothetical protein